MSPIRIVLVDDNAAIVVAWTRLLRNRTDFVMEASLPGSSGLLELVRLRRPDVVLLDLSLPEGDPFDLIASIKRECSGVHTVIYTGRSRWEYEELAKKAGAILCADKVDPPLEILEAIRRLVRPGDAA